MQALKNLKPAAGGKISGPGTPTSDSIPARIAETGEPLQVSNQERILSAKQEALLQRIAELLGFESVDALLEAGTGEQVGPTIKGGKKAAATGMAPEEEKPGTFTQHVMDTAAKDAQAGWDQGGASGVGKAAGSVVRGAIGAIPAAFYDAGKDIIEGPVGKAVGGFISGVSGGDSSPVASVAPAKTTTTPATTTPAAAGSPAATSTDLVGPPAPDAKTSNYLADNKLKSFEDKGGGILRQVGTDGSISFTNVGTEAVADPNKAAPVANSFNMAEGNAALARANAVRQSMIDSQAAGVQAGRGTYTGNGGGMSKERENLLQTVLTPHKGAMNGQLTANQINAARGILSDAQGEHLKGAEIAQRGDEAGQRAALEAARLAQGLPAVEGQQIQNEQGRMLAGLQKKAMSGDQEALATWQAMNSKEKTPRYTTNVVQGAMGEPSTLVVTGPDGQPVMVGTGGEIAQRYAAQQAAKQQAAPSLPPPDKRKVGEVYQTPKGLMVWRGEGWEAAK